MLDIVFGENSKTVAARALQAALEDTGVSGTLYLGYPVLSTADARVFIDALLISKARGLIAFDLTSHLDPRPDKEQLNALRERQDQIYASIYNKLNTHRDLRRGRSLAVDVHVVSFHASLERTIAEPELVACSPTGLRKVISGFGGIDEEILRPLNAAVQRVSTLRPPKKREKVSKENSRGAILKRIEKEIANLDQWQNRGAIEYADGPQRVRGLAGSGKTIVLALKAAYLHVRHPEWKIAVTFQSRSLYQQFRDLIRRFTFDQIEDEPDWSNLLVMHAWGTARDAGVYSTVCGQYSVTPLDWRTADAKYSSRAFEGVCEELNLVIRDKGARQVFDAILIDEAQDFPTSFFRMIYSVIPDPHRIMWAYDDLQNLSDYEMRSERELFGLDNRGQPLVTLRNEPNKPKEDIVLPVCYRNTPWTIATAHALGFGIYRPEGLVQMFADPLIWGRIGYEVTRGELQLDSDVVVRRDPTSYPSYFVELITPNEAIQCETFLNEARQYNALAAAIEKNLQEDELDPTDILVVLPSAYTSRKTGASVMAALAKKNITAHLVGVTASRNEIFSPNSVAITHIYRAKGNEAPMVYVINADFCHGGFDLSRKRNILFTAITRSKCWVRLFGLGDKMRALEKEVDRVRAENFDLSFHYPDEAGLKKLAHVHRDMSDEERQEWERKIDTLADVIRAVDSGDLPLEALPRGIRDKLSSLTKSGNVLRK